MISFRPRDMYRTSTSILRPFAAACIVAVASLGWTAFAAAQVPNTFNNGEVADADKINENFSYVLENASGGCTVEQVDNTAEITCADGSTAVVPGYGTVVVYPEGGITGESPSVSWPTGTVVFRDDIGVILGEASQLGTSTVVYLNQFPATFYNNEESTSVNISGWNAEPVYFLSSDCTGQGFARINRLYEIEASLYVPDDNIEDADLLVKSTRSTGWTNWAKDKYYPAGDCRLDNSVKINLKPLIDYTPAPEILNAAYPVRLEQLP